MRMNTAKMGRFIKGNKGKAKGTINKLTKSVKECFETVFTELQQDPQANLLKWGKENPSEFYKLCAKLIPAAIDMTSKGESIAPLPPPTAEEIKDISDKLENEC